MCIIREVVYALHFCQKRKMSDFTDNFAFFTERGKIVGARLDGAIVTETSIII